MSITAKLTGGNKFAATLDRLAKLGNVELRVGVLEGATDELTGELIAPRAFYNEFGTGGGDIIPARPAFRNTVDEKAGEWVGAIAGTLRGRTTEQGVAEKAFKAVGELARASIQETINSGVGPDLAESTVRQKIKAGRPYPDLQLRDTGSYAKAIAYEVKKK